MDVAMCVLAIILAAVSFCGLAYISKQISDSTHGCDSANQLNRQESRRLERRIDGLESTLIENEVVLSDHRKMIDKRVMLGTLYETESSTGKTGRKIRIVHDNDPDYDAKEA